MDDQERKPLPNVTPLDVFTYEYGRFLMAWGHFEIRSECLIWYLRKRVLREAISALRNCREINPLPMKAKRKKLRNLLLRAEQPDVLKVVERMYENADRNGWVHGHIMLDDGNSKNVTRFRLDMVGHLHYTRVVPPSIEGHTLPFDQFHEDLKEFVKISEETANVTTSKVNFYNLWC